MSTSAPLNYCTMDLTQPAPASPAPAPPPPQASAIPTTCMNPEPLQSIPIPFDSVVASFSLSRPEVYPNSVFNPANGSSSLMKPVGFSLVNGESVKKKRGRPRKYAVPEGGAVLALSPLSSGAGGGAGAATAAKAAGPQLKNGTNEAVFKPKSRVGGVGMGKKQQQQQLNAIRPFGGDFAAHVIVVKAGEDIASKIMAFSQVGQNTVCILSANGAVCNVTLRQPATYGGTISYEGRFEIISLSGSFLLTESGGTRSRTGGMSVSLAGSDGRVLGGGVAGMLIAATPVQVVIGSFSAEDHLKSEQSTREPSATASPYMMGFGTPVAASSPSFQTTHSESSEDTGSPADWNSRAGNNTEQSNPAPFSYSSIGLGGTQPSGLHCQEPHTKFMPN